jgi:beta-lactamase class A
MNEDRALLQQIESRYEGNLHLCALEIGSGQTWKMRENERVSTASTIKLPILMHVAMRVEEGSLRWDDELVLEPADVVAGMGVLRHMKTPRCLTLHDACFLMTAISDNTATNMVIDKVGVEAINERIRSFGLHDTRLNRKAFSPDTEASRPFGLGMSTAFDMMRLMQILYAPETISPDEMRHINLPGPVANGVIRGMLALQQDLVGVARVLPSDWSYAGKTGRISTTRAEAAMVAAPDGRTWLIGIFSFGLTTVNWTVQNEGLLAIAEATEILCGLKS